MRKSSESRAGKWDHKPIIWRRANVRFESKAGSCLPTKNVMRRWFLSSRMQSVEIGDREATLDIAGFDKLPERSWREVATA